MVQDPYKVLNLPHSATMSQIKRSYRELARKYHPDQLTKQNATPEEKQDASTKFAAISAAYALLSDPKRKARYDHIYKYGGYDEDNGKSPERPQSQQSGSTSSTSSSSSPPDSPSRKRKAVGVGYTCTDPLAYIWTQGKIHLTRTIAGVDVPSRIQMTHPGRGLRFAFSSGHVSATPAGARKYTTRTTHFAQGKKYTRTETTIVHPDGRTETIIEGQDFVERRFSTVPVMQQKDGDVVGDDSHQLPWYMNAWQGIREKLTMCYSPCTVTAQ